MFDASITLQNMGKFYLTKSDFGTSHEIYEEAQAVSFSIIITFDCHSRDYFVFRSELTAWLCVFPSQSYWEVHSAVTAI